MKRYLILTIMSAAVLGLWVSGFWGCGNETNQTCGIAACVQGFSLNELLCACEEESHDPIEECAAIDCGGDAVLVDGKCFCVVEGECNVLKCDETHELDRDTCRCVPKTGDFQWYFTCGDPVCRDEPQTIPEGAKTCSQDIVGTACSNENELCYYPEATCGGKIICAASDPMLQGCPISQRSKKADIHYLDTDDRAEVAGQLLATRLASYRYRAAGAKGHRHLGFIIEDQPMSPAILPNGERVDLYAYTSMAVATIQQQQVQIAALQRQLNAMKREMRRMKAKRD